MRSYRRCPAVLLVCLLYLSTGRAAHARHPEEQVIPNTSKKIYTGAEKFSSGVYAAAVHKRGPNRRCSAVRLLCCRVLIPGRNTAVSTDVLHIALCVDYSLQHSLPGCVYTCVEAVLLYFGNKSSHPRLSIKRRPPFFLPVGLFFFQQNTRTEYRNAHSKRVSPLRVGGVSNNKCTRHLANANRCWSTFSPGCAKARIMVILSRSADLGTTKIPAPSQANALKVHPRKGMIRTCRERRGPTSTNCHPQQETPAAQRWRYLALIESSAPYAIIVTTINIYIRHEIFAHHTAAPQPTNTTTRSDARGGRGCRLRRGDVGAGVR